MLKHDGMQTMQLSPTQTTGILPPLPAEKHVLSNGLYSASAHKQQPFHEPKPAGGGSPKSVIRDRLPSANSTYHSCSSSSSAERAAFVHSQQQALRPLLSVDQMHNSSNDKPKCKTVQCKEYLVLVEGNTQTDILDESSTDHSDAQLRVSEHNGMYPNTLDSDFEFDPPSKTATQPLQRPQSFIATTAPASKPNKSYESCVPKGTSLSPEGEDLNALKISHKPVVAPVDSLINMMKQCRPSSFVTEDGKTFRHPYLNEVFANVCNDSFNSDLMRPKFIPSKWDDDEKWTCTKLCPTSANVLSNSTHKVSPFKLSPNEHNKSVLNASHDGILSQPSNNKAHDVQPSVFHPNPSLWDKDTLKNEVDKLSNAVFCAQACLERIQPTPPARSATGTSANTFLAQGVFQKQACPTMATCLLKPNSQVEPLIARGTLRSSHTSTAGIGGMGQFFWGSPIREHTSHSVKNFLPGFQLLKTEPLRPLTAQVGTMKPSSREADSPNWKEQLCIQKHELSEGQTVTATSYMKDASTEITPTASHRDMGTEITPVGSSRLPSSHCSPHQGRAMSPTRLTAPVRPPLPIFQTFMDMRRISPMEMEPLPFHRSRPELLGLSGAGQVQQSLATSFNSNWSSREEEEEEIGKGLRYLDLEDLKRDVLDARATAWKEANKLKLLARYEREQSKIQAWEDMQAAKAQADLKKLEVKLEKKRVQTRAKIADRLDAAHKKAKERRVVAKANRQEAMEKTCHRADEMREEADFFRAKHPLCGCFSQPFS